MKKLNLLLLGLATAGFVACDNDDEVNVITNPGPDPKITDPTFEIPATYVFERDGASTVSFGGQTTRLAQGKEVLSGLKDYAATEVSIDKKFADGEGFSDASLNGSKNIRSKVAESIDFFKDADGNRIETLSDPIREYFDELIENQVSLFLNGQYADVTEVPVAEDGKAGVLGGKRLVNERGLEYDQAFNKGLIGALTLDQIINDYISLTEVKSIQDANTAGTLDGDDNFTEAEHFWDEAYGYLYGASNTDALANPDSVHLDKDNVTDKFLYKYVQRVNGDDDFEGIAGEIFKAFLTGRAAIVAKDYTEVSKQAAILRQKLSEVIAIRAVYYLQQGKVGVKVGAEVTNGNAFHDLSEGYGFIYSLQFTQDAEGNPFFSAADVKGFLDKLDADTATSKGFWKYTADQTDLDDISNAIAAKFDFTVAQAAE